MTGGLHLAEILGNADAYADPEGLMGSCGWNGEGVPLNTGQACGRG